MPPYFLLLLPLLHPSLSIPTPQDSGQWIRTFRAPGSLVSKTVADDPDFRFLWHNPAQSDHLYLGGHGHVYRLNAGDISKTRPADGFAVSPKLGVYYGTDIAHIRLITSIVNGERLWVCGHKFSSNGMTVLELNATTLVELDKRKYISDTMQISPGLVCPDHPLENFTVTELPAASAPRGTPALMVGKKFRRTRVFSERGAINRIPVEPVYKSKADERALTGKSPETDDYNVVLVNPEFAASFEVDDYVYFFLHDAALSGSRDHSTGTSLPVRQAKVVRVCKEDTAAFRINSHYNVWSSLRQAHLECSLPNDDATQKNNQEVLQHVTDASYEATSKNFFVLFSSGPGSPEMTAVCVFSKTAIDQAIESDHVFFEQKTGRSLTACCHTWQFNTSTSMLPVLGSSQCQNLPQQSGGSATAPTFYTVPSRAVVPAFSTEIMMNIKRMGPAFYMYGIAGRRIEVVRGGNNMATLYIVTNRGQLVKASYLMEHVQVNSRGIPFHTKTPASLLAILKPLEHLPDKMVHDTAVINDSLYIVAKSGVVQVDLVVCSVYTRWEECEKDPNCGWINSRCEETTGGCQNNCPPPTPLKRLELPHGYPMVLNFTCLTPFLWKVNGDTPAPEDFMQLADGRLISLQVKQGWNEAKVECRDPRADEVVYGRQLSIQHNKYEEKFNEWCDEFDAYQKAFANLPRL